MQVTSFTEEIADARIRYQVLYLTDSVFVWAQTSPANGGAGSLPSLSLSLPGASAGPLPPAATVLPGAAAAVSQGIAAKLAKRYRMPVYACVDLGGEGILAHAVMKRLVREIDGSGRARAE